MDIDLLSKIFIVLSCVVGGMMDATAGGGGFIMIGTMLAVGIDSHIALGANKLVVAVGATMAFVRFYQRGDIKLNTFPKYALFLTVFGGILGSYFVTMLPSNTIQNIMPAAIVALLIYKLRNFNQGVSYNKKPILSVEQFAFIFPLLIGFYDGFFGPGNVILLIMSMTATLGFSLHKATVYSKLFASLSAIPAALVFTIMGKVVYAVAFLGLSGYLVGIELGVRALKLGPKFMNTVLVVALTGLASRLIYSYYLL